MAGKTAASPTRKAARAASRTRGEARKAANREAQSLREAANRTREGDRPWDAAKALRSALRAPKRAAYALAQARKTGKAS